MLLELGVWPTVVLAVRTQPFAAHSWAQHEHWLVNDRIDHVRKFTPILGI
jgi:Transglutaminase-like superfamily